MRRALSATQLVHGRRPSRSAENAMGSLFDNPDSGHRIGTVAKPRVETAGTDPSRELATQAPHLIGYKLQQFVRLAGSQLRMSAAEIAYHNRAHDRSRRTG